ncbi:MAG: hypothetical protein OJF59_000840 [Cytophagales bacterium]|nr:MAG: hypothetical protein OJF59_000840 [Cytophagales bacterium]
MRLVYILTLTSLTLSFSVKTKDIENELQIRDIYQISDHHGRLERDSVVLISNNEESDFYDQIRIYRGQKLVFDFKEKYLEIIGTPKNVFAEHTIKTYEMYFYIFKMFGGPSPNRFLIIRTSKDKTSVFGKTDSNSADIFGDVDYDGKFEIGGWTDYCQEDKSHKCPDFDLYIVFELDDNFPTDKTLTTFFKKLIKSR